MHQIKIFIIRFPGTELIINNYQLFFKLVRPIENL